MIADCRLEDAGGKGETQGPLPLGGLCDNTVYAVIPIPQSRERDLALSVFKAVRDSSSSAIKSGGLLGMTRKLGLSRRLQGRGLRRPLCFHARSTSG
jgi:hypothetical protein